MAKPETRIKNAIKRLEEDTDHYLLVYQLDGVTNVDGNCDIDEGYVSLGLLANGLAEGAVRQGYDKNEVANELADYIKKAVFLEDVDYEKLPLEEENEH